jgi:hypothetical protein
MGMYRNHIQIPQKSPTNTDPRPTIIGLFEPRHNHSDPDISNGDRIIAIQVGIWHPESYGESTHGWNMQDIQHTISSAIAHKSPLWLLLQRDSLFYPSELACHTPQGSAIQLPTPPLEICGHAIRGRTRKKIIKVDGAKRTLEAMSKGLISYTVQNIEGTPKPNRASVRMKSIHPSAHTQAVMAGLIHLPTWKKVHTKPYLASMATLAGKAMHGTATLCPYQVMRTGSHTQIAMSIRANMEIVGKGETTRLKKEFLGRIYPLNPYTRQGCPCCPSKKIDVCRQFVIANARHYTMGQCTGSAKNMIIDYGNKIAAWIVSQACPGTWSPHSLHIKNARKHT